MEPGQLALMIPIIGVMIPIIAIWAKHQQKKAENQVGNVKSTHSWKKAVYLREEFKICKVFILFYL